MRNIECRFWYGNEWYYKTMFESIPPEWEAEIDYTLVFEFTGLTDKNGVKIFEGDILKYSIGAISGEVIVKYCPGHFYLDGYPFEENAMLNEEWFTEKTEIIGNKFQNPELLNNK